MPIGRAPHISFIEIEKRFALSIREAEGMRYSISEGSCKTPAGTGRIQ